MKNSTSFERTLIKISWISFVSLILLLGLNIYSILKSKDFGSQTACCDGIYFRKFDNAIGKNIKIKIEYTYDNGQTINEIVELLPMTMGSREAEYFFQPYIIGCADGTRIPRVTFSVITNSAGNVQRIGFGRPIPIQIEQPGAGGTPSTINFRVTNEGPYPCCDSPVQAPRAVYTVEMN